MSAERLACAFSGLGAVIHQASRIERMGEPAPYAGQGDKTERTVLLVFFVSVFKNPEDGPRFLRSCRATSKTPKE
jgi:hypothetical protein